MNWSAAMLHPADNVATLLAPVDAGESVRVRRPAGEELTLVATEAIPLGHKIALVDLAAGERVLKYGQCIGETRGVVAQGAWVHTHNLRSLRAQPAPAPA